MKTTYSVNRTTLRVDLSVTLDKEPSQPLRISWGDGAITDTPSGTQHNVPHTYAKPGQYQIVAQGNDVRTTDQVPVGDVLRAYDPDKFTKTPAQMQAREARKAANIAGQVKSATHG